MTGPLLIAAAAGLAAAALVVAGRTERGAAPELVAVLRLLSLVATAVLPLALLVCSAVVVRRATHGGGLSPAVGSSLALALDVLALAFVLRLTWVGLRIARASARAKVSGEAGLLARRIALSGGRSAFVLPVAQPLAYTAGIARVQVVVSEGLLDTLEPEERRALLAHEFAHARNGHQRMLFVGTVVAETLGFLRSIPAACAALRLALEEIADDHAVAVVGDATILARTIAKAALASTPPGALALSSGSEIRERLERLSETHESSRQASAAVGAAVVVVGGVVVTSICLAIHAGALLPDAALCLSALALLVLRPLLRRGTPTVVEVQNSYP